MSDQQRQQQELAVREKRELATKEEKTVPGRFFVPTTDVYETEEALTVVMEVPGVGREEVEIELKDDVLRVEGKIDFAKYGGVEPVYTEYGVGHWARSFSLSFQRKTLMASPCFSRAWRSLRPTWASSGSV